MIEARICFWVETEESKNRGIFSICGAGFMPAMAEINRLRLSRRIFPIGLNARKFPTCHCRRRASTAGPARKEKIARAIETRCISLSGQPGSHFERSEASTSYSGSGARLNFPWNSRARFRFAQEIRSAQNYGSGWVSAYCEGAVPTAGDRLNASYNTSLFSMGLGVRGHCFLKSLSGSCL